MTNRMEIISAISNKGKKLLVLAVIICVIVFVPYFVLKKEMKYRLHYSKSETYYAYDMSGKLNEVYGVMFQNQIDQLINFYDWKLNGEDYEYSDISQIRKLPQNTVVYAQKYLRDSSILYVAFQHYRKSRNDSITWNFFIPAGMLHKKPFVDSDAKRLSH